ncbi:hypothetical protein RF55_11865 [Lasius niger]|uniref:Secreted protein n=1 Tax=Lasius niger TaxID=67767 RepID=A0A0J7KE91_LASNI|nr:hypothetical protein RF55_11865 [Lasius niger]
MLIVVLIIVIVVVVIGGNEEIVLLQEIGYVLADRGADQETEHDTADDAQETEWSSLRFGQDCPGWCGYRRPEKRLGYCVRLFKDSRAAKQRPRPVQQHSLLLRFIFR